MQHSKDHSLLYLELLEGAPTTANANIRVFDDWWGVVTNTGECFTHMPDPEMRFPKGTS